MTLGKHKIWHPRSSAFLPMAQVLLPKNRLGMEVVDAHQYVTAGNLLVVPAGA
ncbi:hypothetical protein PISMIDRAFT_442014 [Pisolithus microcarpus 441]|uniref:Uncharacterized protein n=1 Tax=Pisolithus microcarpus 441 TaxID=765257 RepID=A0A0C9ZKC8_9AGAM|nr:hypothetical protein PISMIDRAFT_442014 [Pisolithus microcarpus 441]